MFNFGICTFEFGLWETWFLVQISLYFQICELICYIFPLWQLTLRRVMDEAKKSTRSGSLNEVSMVLLNNLLSLPFAIFLIILFGEWEYVINV